MSQLHSDRNNNEEEFPASGSTFGEIGVVSPDSTCPTCQRSLYCVSVSNREEQDAGTVPANRIRRTSHGAGSL